MAIADTENRVDQAGLDRAFQIAESLGPDDRLRLIVRLWASLPPEHWAAPTLVELADVHRRMGDYDTGRNNAMPWDIPRRILADRTQSSSPRIYSAPRRFDLATIFIATAAYSVLFTGMTLLDFAPIYKLYVGALITLVGASQALLLSVLNPRRASMIAGAAVHTVFSLILWSMYPWFLFGSFFLIVIINGLLLGALIGYLAGAMAAGVFLVADILRGKMLVTHQQDDQQSSDFDEEEVVARGDVGSTVADRDISVCN